MESPLKLFTRGNDAPEWTGFLDRGSRVEGTLDVPGVFRLDGALAGRIRSGELLVLGPTAEVEGEIEGEQVVIYGCFRGTLCASVKLEIHSKARVYGDIYTPCLLLEPGGLFEGHCYLNSADAGTDPVLVEVRANSGPAAAGINSNPGPR